MATVLGANSVTGGYDVENSCRFNDASSDHLLIAPSGAGNLKTWTWSAWIKRGTLGTRQVLFSGYDQAAGLGESIEFTSGNLLEYDLDIAGTDNTVTSAIQFLDTNAWYNIVFVKDLTQGTETNRIKVFVNGVQLTLAEDGNGYPAENATTGLINAAGNYEHHIGTLNSAAEFFDGYMSEVVFIDGTANDEEDFGEFDEDSGIWKPIDVSGLTYGTNGFYLEFKQVGTSANASGIGADTSGNTHHLTVANLTAVDQTTDTCTNNFATFNPLGITTRGQVYSEGNCNTRTVPNAAQIGGFSSIGVSSGKWFAEFQLYSFNTNRSQIGVSDNPVEQDRANTVIGESAHSIAYAGENGDINANSSGVGSGDSYGEDDIVGVALNLDDNNILFYKNGAVQNSGTALSITAAASTTTGLYFFAVGDGDGSYKSQHRANFGNPTVALSSAVSDANGHGSFEFAVPSGYLALCTKNLAESG